MTPDEAISFVREHGVVLASARGPRPNLAEAVAGGPIRGSWWGHPQGRAIFAALRAVEGSPEILVCRVVQGKISFVHRRLWPALARLAHRFPAERLAQVRQEHGPSGRHLNRTTAFPDWVPSEVAAAAARLSEDGALAALGDWVPAPRE